MTSDLPSSSHSGHDGKFVVRPVRSYAPGCCPIYFITLAGFTRAWYISRGGVKLVLRPVLHSVVASQWLPLLQPLRRNAPRNCMPRYKTSARGHNVRAWWLPARQAQKATPFSEPLVWLRLLQLQDKAGPAIGVSLFVVVCSLDLIDHPNAQRIFKHRRALASGGGNCFSRVDTFCEACLKCTGCRVSPPRRQGRQPETLTAKGDRFAIFAMLGLFLYNCPVSQTNTYTRLGKCGQVAASPTSKMLKFY